MFIELRSFFDGFEAPLGAHSACAPKGASHFDRVCRHYGHFGPGGQGIRPNGGIARTPYSLSFAPVGPAGLLSELVSAPARLNIQFNRQKIAPKSETFYFGGSLTHRVHDETAGGTRNNLGRPARCVRRISDE